MSKHAQKTVTTGKAVQPTMQLALVDRKTLDEQTTDVGGGLLVPFSLPSPLPAKSIKFQEYRYQLLAGHPLASFRQSGAGRPVYGKCVIYAPSLLGICAHALLASVPHAGGLILDKLWAGSPIRLLRLSARLQYERLRLGRDVQSPSLRKHIYRANLQHVLAHLTIGHWLDALAQIRQNPHLLQGNCIFWQDKTHTDAMHSWIASRLGNTIK